MPEARIARAIGRGLLGMAVICLVSAALAFLASDRGSLAGAGWVLGTLAVLLVVAAFIAYDVDDKHRGSPAG